MPAAILPLLGTADGPLGHPVGWCGSESPLPEGSRFLFRTAKKKAWQRKSRPSSAGGACRSGAAGASFGLKFSKGNE